MAQQPYPNQGAPPQQPNPAAPPAYSYQPPPQVQNVKVVHVAHEQPKQQKGGLFGSFMREVDKVGKQLCKEADYVSNNVNKAIDKNWSSSLMDMFRNGNTVQLVSRGSGGTVQIVMAPGNALVLDALGPLDPGAFNTLWTVTNHGNNQIQLSNYNNYLAIQGGNTIIVPVPQGSVAGPETRFQLSQLQMQFITLESLAEPLRHVGFTKDGKLKAAAGTGKEMDAHFGVKLVSTAYPTMTPTGAAPAKK